MPKQITASAEYSAVDTVKSWHEGPGGMLSTSSCCISAAGATGKPFQAAAGGHSASCQQGAGAGGFAAP